MSDLALPRHPLPVGATGRVSAGWWGMLCVIATEGALFGYLLFTYYYLATQLGPNWRPTDRPHFSLSAPNTAILILSSVAVWFAGRGVRRGRRPTQIIGLAIGLGLGIAFVVIQLKEWSTKTFTPRSSGYGSVFFTVTGFHLAHVVVGLVVLLMLLVWSLFGYIDRRRSAAMVIGSAYWHFVDAVWLFVFFTFYITPLFS